MMRTNPCWCAFLSLALMVILAVPDVSVAGSMRSGGGSSNRYYSSTPVYYYPIPSNVAVANNAAPASDEDYAYGATEEAGNVVRINVRVPVNAEVSFDGNKTSQTGSLRSFVTPALERGKEYSYEIRVRWVEAGRPVEQARKINIRPGDRLTLEFRP